MFYLYLYFRSLIDQYFGGTFDVELKCVEAEDEPVSKNKEQFLQLSCFISQDVRYMHSGLKNVSNSNKSIIILLIILFIFLCDDFLYSKLKNLQKMQEQLTKKSPTLDRDAVYIKTVSISTVQKYSNKSNYCFHIVECATVSLQQVVNHVDEQVTKFLCIKNCMLLSLLLFVLKLGNLLPERLFLLAAMRPDAECPFVVFFLIFIES